MSCYPTVSLLIVYHKLELCLLAYCPTVKRVTVLLSFICLSVSYLADLPEVLLTFFLISGCPSASCCSISGLAVSLSHILLCLCAISHHYTVNTVSLSNHGKAFVNKNSKNIILLCNQIQPRPTADPRKFLVRLRQAILHGRAILENLL